MRADERTDGHTETDRETDMRKLTVAFRNFVNAPIIYHVHALSQLVSYNSLVNYGRAYSVLKCPTNEIFYICNLTLLFKLGPDIYSKEDLPS